MLSTIMAMTMKLETKEGSADTLTFLINLSLGRCLDDLMELGCRFREFLNTTSVGKLGKVDSEGRSILAFLMDLGEISRGFPRP